MAAKCDVCGKNTRKFSTITGSVICCKTCLNAYLLEGYLERLESRRDRDEEHNKQAYAQARVLSGCLSIYRHGNKEAKKRAAKAINTWAR
jgi:hypothetical protein